MVTYEVYYCSDGSLMLNLDHMTSVFKNSRRALISELCLSVAEAAIVGRGCSTKDKVYYRDCETHSYGENLEKMCFCSFDLCNGGATSLHSLFKSQVLLTICLMATLGKNLLQFTSNLINMSCSCSNLLWQRGRLRKTPSTPQQNQQQQQQQLIMMMRIANNSNRISNCFSSSFSSSSPLLSTSSSSSSPCHKDSSQIKTAIRA